MSALDLPPRPVSVGTFKATPAMYTALGNVLASGRISYGDYSLQFEREFAARHGCNYGIFVNSGTSALHIALQAMVELYRWEPGTHVIVPATTFIATANIVRHCRMTPIFVDVDPLTYNIDPEKVEDILKRDNDVRCILPVHLFGQPADMSSIMELASRFGKQVLADSCETMFATHNGKPLGYWGDIICFSTYVAHLLVTGVGGLAITDNPDCAAIMRSLANHGLNIEHLNPDENFSPRPTPNRRFRFDYVGHSYRATELEAALGLVQLNTIGNDIAIRTRNARHLSAGLCIINNNYGDPFQVPTVAPGNTSSNMMYPLVLNKKDGQMVDKEPLMQWLGDNLIETRDMLPILGSPVYSYLHPSDYPVSEWILKSGLYLGCHQDLTPSDMQYVLKVIEAYCDQGGQK